MNSSAYICLILLPLVATGCTAAANAVTATPALPAGVVPPAAEQTASGPDHLPALLERLHWLGNASFRLEAPPVIYLDPTQAQDSWPKADIILISHGHGDHYAPAALKSLSSAATLVITNAAMAELVKKDGIPAAEVRVMKPGDSTVVGDISIAALPAYNVNKSFHPKEAGNLGFMISIQGEKLYFAGDTDLIPEMKGLHPDVALLPIGGTYTMDVKEAAQAAIDLQARVVVPMHNRDTDPEQFRSLYAGTVVVMNSEK